MTASGILALVMIISSFGALTPLAVVMVVPFGIGALRLVPFVNNKFWGGVRRGGRSARRRAGEARRRRE